MPQVSRRPAIACGPDLHTFAGSTSRSSNSPGFVTSRRSQPRDKQPQSKSESGNRSANLKSVLTQPIGFFRKDVVTKERERLDLLVGTLNLVLHEARRYLHRIVSRRHLQLLRPVRRLTRMRLDPLVQLPSQFFPAHRHFQPVNHNRLSIRPRDDDAIVVARTSTGRLTEL